MAAFVNTQFAQWKKYIKQTEKGLRLSLFANAKSRLRGSAA